jgi:hypothetical protein
LPDEVLGPSRAVAGEPFLRDAVEDDVEQHGLELRPFERPLRLLAVAGADELRTALRGALQRARVLEAVLDDEDPQGSVLISDFAATPRNHEVRRRFAHAEIRNQD